MQTKFGTVKSNPYEIISDNADVQFEMLKSNETELEQQLNQVRKNVKKFLCLNDNFDDVNNQTQEIALKKILNEFYQSLFPLKSDYENEDGVENEHLHIQYYEDKINGTHSDSIVAHVDFICLLILINSVLLIIALL